MIKNCIFERIAPDAFDALDDEEIAQLIQIDENCSIHAIAHESAQLTLI
jgi:uncharacterized OsmC-like protein